MAVAVTVLLLDVRAQRVHEVEVIAGASFAT
jgi:hypothetical protein